MRIATCECYKCHHIVPKTEASQETAEVYTGKSGPSFSFNLTGKSAKPRFNSGRNYYRKKTVWVCNDCKTSSSMSFGQVLIVLIICIIIFAVVMG